MPEIQIKKSFRKTLSMRFDKNGVLQVKAPVFLTQGQIQKFIHENQKWIEKHEKQKQDSILDPSKVSLYKKQAQEVIIPRVEELAKEHGFMYNSIKITSAQTRWGSCTSKKNLNFTYRLVLAPQKSIDYVIIHELCHLRHMNHSRRFWDEVAKIMPDYKVHEKWLKDHGATIS